MSEAYVERCVRVWTGHGEHFEISEDRDGLGMVEVRFFSDDGAPCKLDGLTFTIEQAAMVADAMREVSKHLGDSNGVEGRETMPRLREIDCSCGGGMNCTGLVTGYQYVCPQCGGTEYRQARSASPPDSEAP